MVYDVLVTQDANKHYIARVLSLPDIIISGPDETDVLQQVHDAIARLQNNSRLVRLSIPSPLDRDTDPWVQAAGMWANDPDWEKFQQAIEAYRHTLDTDTERPQ